MHVVYVSPTFPPDTGWGGIGSYTHHIAGMLAKAGHEVTVLCGVGDMRRESTSGGVRVCRYLSSAPADTIEFATEVADAIDALREEKHVDIVEFPEYAANGIVFQRRHPSFPVVVRLHGDTALCAQANASPLKRAILQRMLIGSVRTIDRLERESAWLAHVVTSPSQWEVGQCVRRNWKFQHEPFVIANAYDLKNEERSQPLCSHPGTVVHLARLDYRKGATLIPAVLSQVLSAVPEARFEFIGQDSGRGRGSWTDWIGAQTPVRFHGQLTFHGGVPHEQVPELLRGKSIAFFGSAWENFPYTLLECMSVGIACVNGSIGGAHEVGIHDVSVLNTARTSEAIAQAIILLLKNATFREQLSRNAIARVHDLCGTQAISLNAITTYRTAIARAAAPIANASVGVRNG